jgi:hypothetical protein
VLVEINQCCFCRTYRWTRFLHVPKLTSSIEAMICLYIWRQTGDRNQIIFVFTSYEENLTQIFSYCRDFAAFLRHADMRKEFAGAELSQSLY